MTEHIFRKKTPLDKDLKKIIGLEKAAQESGQPFLRVGLAVLFLIAVMMGALVIAAVFEPAGAILAGGDVVSTIKKGIIDPSLMPGTTTFIHAMMAALLAAALWLNLATFLGAPVSTPHSIVGGVGVYREFLSNKKRRMVRPNTLGKSAELQKDPTGHVIEAALDVDEILKEKQEKKLKRSAKRKRVQCWQGFFSGQFRPHSRPDSLLS